MAGAAAMERVGPVREASYLVTVQTGGWDDAAGDLALWRWENGWQSDGKKIPVMIGKSGLAWGRGLHGESAPEGVSGPEKKEGDGRSPAGAFRLGTSYGYAASPPAGTQAQYQAMTPTLQCIEDTKSAYYNQVVDRALIAPDWDSTDLLRRDDGLYEFIIFVEQNVGPAVPGRGSCILFHVWTGPTKPTAGCTSMERDDLERVVRSLAPQDSMVVQLPQGVYEQLREGWQLP
jgi:zinc D-Ala-D-Ala dipeptidase